MKRPAIIIATLLYLSIVTGGFVCMVHCLSNTLLHSAEIAHEHPETKTGDSEDKKGECEDGKGCDCCSEDQHFYFVKENVKPGTESQIAKISINLNFGHFIPGEAGISSLLSILLPDAHAPPFVHPSPSYIRYHSLLI